MRYFDDDVVTETILYSFNQDIVTEDEMTVCYGTDSGFMLGAAVSIASVIKENQGANLSFHIFTNEVKNDFLTRFEALAEKNRVSIFIHIINEGVLSALPSNRLWSTAIYYRFIIADYFSDKREKVLYIDSDVVCLGSISSLFSIELKENILAAVTERDESWWKNRANTLGKTELIDGYYNSGVLLINTGSWAKNSVTVQAISLLNNDVIRSSLTYYDQDVLNIITIGKVLFLGKKYNTQYSLNYELKEKPNRPNTDSVIFLHYIGPTKPWHEYAYKYEIALPYFSVKNASPWCDIPFQSPTSSMQYRYAAKHYVNHKAMLLAIKSYFLYFKSKVIG
ncbi:Lipopolysaccharide 1,2-glucosyltransferase [Leminorella richardii]|uniref:Lipopolysaccharide 1,2-glucosyltransferase n=1 Tax=Leminorella richardii TaxID=158841 RepID=A0A2X4XG48_9GAMM|nr:glycosyltransferase [Leminorella richardii]SQI35654.1 Lipopolysaccharide 1,2-glucosyltransferase [Leminorella richardii]